MIICGLKGFNIFCSHITGLAEITAPPCKGFASETLDQKVCHQACVTTVPVREGMNCNKPIM